LLAFIQPAWLEVMELVNGDSSVDSRQTKLKNMGGSQLVLDTWARAASQKPEIIQQLNSIMSNERLWGRFQALVPGTWSQGDKLIDMVTPETRAAFSRIVKTESSGNSQLAQARYRQEDQAALSLGRLISGGQSAADDPVINKLRGPQTVGEFMSADARWTWPEFTPRQGEGDDSDSIGTGVDIGRFPSALWSQNPSESWYVLEALARYRKGDRSAPLLPLESKTGSETDRILLAVSIAKSMGDAGLALELDARKPISGSDARRVQARVQLLNANKENKRSLELWKSYIVSRQKDINSSELADLARFAERNGLPDTLGLLDASKPVHPDLLALLVNADLSAFTSYKTPDISSFRYALFRLWYQNEANLSAAQTRFWTRELWATDSAPLPNSGLSKLGGLWPHARRWLSEQPISKRFEILDAVEAGGKAMINVLRQSDKNDDSQTLTARAMLTMGDSATALAVLDRWIDENRNSDFLRASELARLNQEEREEYDRGYQYDRPLVDRVRLWAEVFSAGSARLEAAVRLSKMLREQYESAPISGDAWVLALDLCEPESRASLLKSLDRSWFMGQVNSENIGGLVEALAKYVPQKALLWLKRWPLNYSFQNTRQRAGIYVALKQPKEAAKAYITARQFAFWSMADDLRAFNEWRRLDTGSQGPDLWLSALKIWGGNPAGALAAQLKAHPLDCYSATSALETARGVNEDEIIRVEQSIRHFISDNATYALLYLKAARNWLPTSWRTAAQYINNESWDASPVDTYFNSMKKLKPDDVNGAMADLVRVYRLDGKMDNALAAFAVIQGRKYAGLDALRKELDRPTPTKLVDYQMVNGRPVPILPKDMTWELLTTILEAKP